MKTYLDITCPRCGVRESTTGLDEATVREIAASHVCPDGVRTLSGEPTERLVPGPGERMTQDRWERLTPAERERLRDLSGLSPQLIGLEGWRVEVIRQSGKWDRFIVGRSTGWRPCSLEIRRRDSSGGMAADYLYQSVRKIEKVR